MIETPRVVFITGGASGMGAAAARLFAENGRAVAVADRDEARGQALASELVHGGHRALFVATDVADADSVDAAVAETVASFGRLDEAVNCAALAPDTTVTAESSLEEFDRIIAVNLRGMFVSLRAELRQLLAQGNGGAIVNLASIRSRRAKPASPAYCSSKAGVVSLTQVAASEVRTAGIRVNAVCPGAIDTPMLRTAVVAIRGQQMADFVAAQRHGVGSAEDVAAACLWLCGEGAAFVTGVALPVDGGYTAVGA